MLYTGSRDTDGTRPEPINGVGAEQPEQGLAGGIKPANGTAGEAAEVHEGPDSGGAQESADVAVLSGEGLQANHAPPSSEQQQPASAGISNLPGHVKIPDNDFAETTTETLFPRCAWNSARPDDRRTPQRLQTLVLPNYPSF